MALSVIGAGYGRTGTLSLKAALEQLGYLKCHHMIEVLQSPAQIEGWMAAARGSGDDTARAGLSSMLVGEAIYRAAASGAAESVERLP